jgi:fructose-1,6-bisphosphatase/inositol monophosphatase family enzyme
MLDASIDLRGKIRLTDIAASYLIVKEADGKIYFGGKGLDGLDINMRLRFAAIAHNNISEEFID